MEIYRVRKSFGDIKSQQGAFFILENAIKKAKATKCNVYDGNKNCVWVYSEERGEKMNSPYKGRFRVSQQYKGTAHDGLDLVGVDSKNIYSTVYGTVEYAGWENALNHKQGFGRYVRIKKDNSADRYYFGHLSSIKVKKGQAVNPGDVIGIEGNTGYSFGSHCHYCVRANASKKQIKNISEISGIPNSVGMYNDDAAKITQKRVKYYPEYKGKTVSIVTALNSLGFKSSFSYRKTIANANGIKLFLGTAKQNTKLLNLLKNGKLIKP